MNLHLDRKRICVYAKENKFNIELKKGMKYMPFDYSRLNGKISEIFGTQKRFAAAMELSERSLSLKMNRKVPWKQTEIMRACQLLGLQNSDIPNYFFTLEVQY